MQINRLSFFCVLMTFLGFGMRTMAQQDLRLALQNIVNNKKAVVGIAVWHMEKQDTISINGHRHVPMQSVFKLPIALATLDMVDKGKLKLNQKIKFEKSELMPVTHSPMRDQYPEGGEVTLREMIQYTVSNSDNNACDILLDKIGGVDVVQNYMNKIGIKDFQIVANEAVMHQNSLIQYQNYWSANSANELLLKLYTTSILKPNSKKEIIQVLESTNTGINRLKKDLPKGTIIAHKTGSSGTEAGKTAATNDIGIITLPNQQHIIISVFVSDSYENDVTNEKIIADVAKLSFDYYSR